MNRVQFRAFALLSEPERSLNEACNTFGVRSSGKNSGKDSGAKRHLNEVQTKESSVQMNSVQVTGSGKKAIRWYYTKLVSVSYTFGSYAIKAGNPGLNIFAPTACNTVGFSGSDPYSSFVYLNRVQIQKQNLRSSAPDASLLNLYLNFYLNF